MSDVDAEKTIVLQDGDCTLSVRIHEIHDPQYGLFVWPSAHVLAQYVLENRSRLPGSAVLELGCGVGLPGITAALLGARVLLTDLESAPRVLQNASRNIALNAGCAGAGERLFVQPLTWGCLDERVTSLPPLNLILAADCFFEAELFDDLLVTLRLLCERSRGCVCWTAYHERSVGATCKLHLLAERYGLALRPLALRAAHWAAQQAPSVQLLELSWRGGP